ncbi:MAG: hypothetical protein MMC33_009653 [Icmadophila ericetorum]|nr:hypothetical protein [Icmadophila ericetorum]
MPKSGRWSSHQDRDDRYDLANGPDSEKQEWDKRDSSSDTDDVPPRSSFSSSRETYESQQPILGAPKRRMKSSSFFSRPPCRTARFLTIRWLCFALMSTVILFIIFLVRMSYASAKAVEQLRIKAVPPPAPWESFEFLKRYYGGIRTLVPRERNIPEYPSDAEPTQAATNQTTGARALLSSTPFHPYPDYTSAAYELKYDPVQECYLDESDQVKVPDVYSYVGVPQGFPDAVMGSYDLLNISSNVCFERYGRLGPYGFGYSLRKGGSGAGLHGDREGAEDVWKSTQEVDYTKVNWGDAQKRCMTKNHHRFRGENATFALQDSFLTAGKETLKGRQETTATAATKKLPRSAVLIRTWWDFQYTQEDIIYLRSLIAELSLKSGGEYTVYFLVHVKDDNMAIWADQKTYDKVLENSLPKEFQGMGVLWSERQMGLIYGGLAESFYRDLPVHGVYRSTYMTLQWFAHQHPEFDFFWNWEMDIRYTGHWYHLFDSVSKWTTEQPRKGLWERSSRFYVPSVYGSWEDFKQMARIQSEMVVNPNHMLAGLGQEHRDGSQPKPDTPVWGPLAPQDVLKIDDDPAPPTTYEKDKYTWGVGEDADLVTFNPIFDPDQTTWILSEDVTGYDTESGLPPRRTAIVTASRLSRRLLDTMHREVALQRHTMFSEMWPASCALHHGLKAVYAPHPVYVDRNWPLDYLANVFNGGKNGASGGARMSIFGEREHNFRGTTWYYNAGFSPNLWRRWLGYRVDGNGGEEEEIADEGRMCVPAMLLHPVKDMELIIEGRPDEVQLDQAEGGGQ